MNYLQGIVTQVTDVKPLLTVATYLDKNEATEAYQEVSGASSITSSRFRMEP
jgi:DNA replicative helicase MCM subunit Mcm2 (Cdc46/Mcm family)